MLLPSSVGEFLIEKFLKVFYMWNRKRKTFPHDLRSLLVFNCESEEEWAELGTFHWLKMQIYVCGTNGLCRQFEKLKKWFVDAAKHFPHFDSLAGGHVDFRINSIHERVRDNLEFGGMKWISISIFIARTCKNCGNPLKWESRCQVLVSEADPSTKINTRNYEIFINATTICKFSFANRRYYNSNGIALFLRAVKSWKISRVSMWRVDFFVRTRISSQRMKWKKWSTRNIS